MNADQRHAAQRLDMLGIVVVNMIDPVDGGPIPAVSLEDLAPLLSDLYIEEQGIPVKRHQSVLYGAWQDGPSDL